MVPLPLFDKEEVAMPTDVHFIGVEKPMRLAEDYDKVNSQLHASDALFNRLVGDGNARVTVYKSAIAYIEEAVEVEPFVMTG
jgi:hypothetical protein